jgi:uncharacterized protein YcfL
MNGVFMTKFLVAMTAVAVGFLAGCASHRDEPVAVVVTPEMNLKTEPTKALQISDPASRVVGTANNIRITRIITSSTNNLLYVQAEFLNDRGRRDVVDYRVRWMDANGVQVAQYDPWVAASLEGKESSLLNFTAPRPEATDFRIEIKSHY